jgi:hypothetical protein
MEMICEGGGVWAQSLGHGGAGSRNDMFSSVELELPEFSLTRDKIDKGLYAVSCLFWGVVAFWVTNFLVIDGSNSIGSPGFLKMVCLVEKFDCCN